MATSRSIAWLRLGLVLSGTLAVCYALAVLWFVSTTPDPGVRVLLSDPPLTGNSEWLPGVILRRIVGQPILIDKAGPKPAAGDRLLVLGETPVQSFLDFTGVVAELRSFDLPPGGLIQESNRAVFESRLILEFQRLPPLVEQAGTGDRFIRMRLERGDRQYQLWMPQRPLPLKIGRAHV